MRLGGAPIKEFCDYNDFCYGPIVLNQCNAATFYFQLVDLNQKLCADLDGTCFLRYFPAVGSTLLVRISCVAENRTIYRAATQNPTDPSIWSVPIFATDVIGSSDVYMQLTEPTLPIKTGIIMHGLIVKPVPGQNGCPGSGFGDCGC